MDGVQTEDGETTTRFAVSVRRTGIGDCLVSLSSAWHYAKRTGRTLVTDWRYSRYTPDYRTNAFSLLFEPVSEIGGVPVTCDDSVNELKLPEPVHRGLGRGVRAKQLVFALANMCGLLRFDFMRERVEGVLHRAQRVELDTLAGERDRAEPTVLFEQCLPEIGPIERDDEAFLSGIQPRKDIRGAMDHFE
jgi:hypothetical protein